MNITLRKANAIQASIMEAIKAIRIETSVDLNEFQDVEKVLIETNQEVFANDARRQRLLLSYYNIRGLVGSANATSGIDLALTKAAFIDKRIEQLSDLASAKVITDIEIIKGKMDKIRNRKEESRASIYGRDETISTSVIHKEQIAQVKAEVQNLKKQKQKLNDEILELNVKTEIPLSEETVAVLKAENLI